MIEPVLLRSCVALLRYGRWSWQGPYNGQADHVAGIGAAEDIGVGIDGCPEKLYIKTGFYRISVFEEEALLGQPRVVEGLLRGLGWIQ